MTLICTAVAVLRLSFLVTTRSTIPIDKGIAYCSACLLVEEFYCPYRTDNELYTNSAFLRASNYWFCSLLGGPHHRLLVWRSRFCCSWRFRATGLRKGTFTVGPNTLLSSQRSRPPSLVYIKTTEIHCSHICKIQTPQSWAWCGTV